MPDMPKFQMPEWAKKKVGPFPVWAYGAVGGGLLLALYLKGHPFTPGTAGTATIGGPGSAAGLGAGNLPTGTRPGSTLETSPPGSPQPPGRVPSNFTPAHFVSQWHPSRLPGGSPPVSPVPQVSIPHGPEIPVGDFATTIAQLGPGIGDFARSENLGLGSYMPPNFGNIGFGGGAFETGMEMPVGFGSAFGLGGGAFARSESGFDIGIGNGTQALSAPSYNPGISGAAYAPASSFVDLAGYTAPGGSFSPAGGYSGTPSGGYAPADTGASSLSSPGTSGVLDTSPGFVADASGSAGAPAAVGSGGNFVA